MDIDSNSLLGDTDGVATHNFAPGESAGLSQEEGEAQKDSQSSEEKPLSPIEELVSRVDEFGERKTQHQFQTEVNHKIMEYIRRFSIMASKFQLVEFE